MGKKSITLDMGNEILVMLESDIAKFWSMVNIAGDDDCWEWKRGRTERGYGSFCVHNKTRRSHRVAYALVNGPIPRGILVCHNCPDGDNPACCNPRHLWLGTQKDNTQDAIKKGRMCTDELRKADSERKKGVPLCESARWKISVANIGNQRALGYVHTNDCKAGISESLKGHAPSFTGHHSDESRRKISESQKKRYAEKKKGNGNG
jgi:hypothetical protein